ncbi:MAG TPA: hypothetical protein DCM87_10980 [Planctomycetes bacterium]|nr:hypothetical protein [Planctomycetota bacterium]
MMSAVLLSVIMLADGTNPPLPAFDLTSAAGCEGWEGLHDVGPLERTAEGLAIPITGGDPYIAGPARDYPRGVPLWLVVRLKSELGGTAQVFHFTAGPREEASVRFAVPAGEWHEARVRLPALESHTRLRFDPPGSGGTCVLASVRFEARATPLAPAWPRPAAPQLDAGAPEVRSAELCLRHGKELGEFVLRVGDREMAVGWNRPLLGYQHGDKTRWVDLHAQGTTAVEAETGGLMVRTAARDPDGADWTITQRFAPNPNAAGAIDVRTSVRADRDRTVIFAPLLVLLPGAGTYGAAKTQALFAGVEYLDKNEPSSSEADLIGSQSQRQVPDTLMLTMPLMALAHEGRWIALAWEEPAKFAALFDSPDRMLNAGGHVMGLLLPHADGADLRPEGGLLPYAGQLLRAGAETTLRATLLGGAGKSVVPAVEGYLALRGLPPVPDARPDLAGYVRLAATGWMDSGIRDGNRYRHAFPGHFAPQPAADAAMWLDWLAAREGDAAEAARLREAAAGALAEAPPGNYYHAAVGHVRYPAAPLLYGHVADAVRAARAHGRALLGRFEPDGTVRYRPGAVDYGKTHFAPDANGLSAHVVQMLLDAAAFSGDPQLIEEGLRALRALDKFEHTVPRGAQTWECPLHTPDILASAHLVRAYTLGHELTGDARLLESARHWAWTGVPFVYLRDPANAPGGRYATIAVLGATNWQAPNWLGLPVQWCGLVYADALYRLAPHDPGGPWRQLACGITASGVQQTVPLDGDASRRGLLPDSFALRTGGRNDPVINPGTVQACALRLYGQPAAYDFASFRTSGLLVHAPGAIVDRRDGERSVGFKVRGCVREEYYVLVTGLRGRALEKVTAKGPAGADALDGAVETDAKNGWAVLRLRGDAIVEVNPGTVTDFPSGNR